MISTPKQANTSTITSTLTSPFNAAITAPTVAKSSSAAQISISVAVGNKSNAARRSSNTSAPNAVIHSEQSNESVGGSSVFGSNGVSPSVVVSLSPTPIFTSPLLPTEP